MTEYCKCVIVPKKNFDGKYSTTVKYWLPDIYIIPFMEKNEWKDLPVYKGSYHQRLERQFAIRNDL
jgi:hypothetical protein